MTNATIIPFRPLRKLIFTFPESDLSRLVAEGYALACYEPRILELIDQDRDAHALAKKKARILDRDWLMSRGSPLPGFNAEVEEGWADELELAAGRPRMAVVTVWGENQAQTRTGALSAAGQVTHQRGLAGVGY